MIASFSFSLEIGNLPECWSSLSKEEKQIWLCEEAHRCFEKEVSPYKLIITECDDEELVE